MKTILVADLPRMDARYSAALGGWEVEFVRTLGEARQAMRRGSHDLVAVGVYFDDSQVFELVRMLRTDERHARTPIVCVRERPAFAAVSNRSLETAVKALGAEELVDLPGGEEDDRELREAAERLTSSG